jgi:hypothetical protein
MRWRQLLRRASWRVLGGPWRGWCAGGGLWGRSLCCFFELVLQTGEGGEGMRDVRFVIICFGICVIPALETTVAFFFAF